MKVILHPQAKRDLNDLASYIANDSLNSAKRFVAAIEKIVNNLEALPQLGSRYHLTNSTLLDIRMWPLPGFPKILIFYRASKMMRFSEHAGHLHRLMPDTEIGAWRTPISV